MHRSRRKVPRAARTPAASTAKVVTGFVDERPLWLRWRHDGFAKSSRRRPSAAPRLVARVRNCQSSWRAIASSKGASAAAAFV